MNKEEKLKALNIAFGSYRAEWLNTKIFDFFATPDYFISLKDNRPCVLQGGRGTGKTTVLKGLSYEGQFALSKNDITKFDDINFIGIYHRFNTNHVRSFIGKGIDDDKWQDIFAHYFNLIICNKILQFVKWHKKQNNNDKELSLEDCRLLLKSFLLDDEVSSFDELISIIEGTMYDFQSRINNISELKKIKLSMAGDPFSLLTSKVLNLPQFKNKMFYILLDEYENLEDNQQEVINSLIKHSTKYYTFKIGVRELGWRIKNTKNEQECLNDPADYALIKIENEFTESEEFEIFAKDVCQKRLAQVDGEGVIDIEESLKGLSIDNEAEILGVNDTDYMKIFESMQSDYKDIVNGMPSLYKFFLVYWSKIHDKSLETIMRNLCINKKQWDTRYENYKYSMLFKIRRGRGKGGFQKYYCGWKTYLKLANGNIRYLMELVYKAYEIHIKTDNPLDNIISPENQTEAAKNVGEKNLEELEGLWKNGAALTRLLFGLGHVYRRLARGEDKKRPEINQFNIKGEISKETNEILNSAVMNLALLRFPGNKQNGDGDTKKYLYSIHPIFAAFFNYSFRKKRKMDIPEQTFLLLTKDPDAGAKEILGNDIYYQDEHNKPIQLDLFEND